jgi:hypothetical protein
MSLKILFDVVSQNVFIPTVHSIRMVPHVTPKNQANIRAVKKDWCEIFFSIHIEPVVD